MTQNESANRYYWKHHDKVLRKARERHAANRKHEIAERKEYYSAHREEVLRKAKERYRANPEPVKDYQKEYHRRNRSYCLVRAKRYHEAHKGELKAEVMAAYGGKCTCCGEDQLEFLTIDHINGGGNKHRRSIGWASLYRWLKKNGFPKKGFQVLCWNCNIAKGFYGKCPHQKALRLVV